MSHELENANDMVYVGATPWHGLGEKVDAINSLPACLDWHVTKQPVYVYQNNAFVQVDEYQAIIRDNTGKILGMVTDQYQPHQNKDLWNSIKAFTDAGEMQIETAGTLKGGKLVWTLAKIDASFSTGTDRQDLYALLATGHDGKLSSTVKATAIRVVCNNTLSIALREGKEGLRQTHRSSFKTDLARDFVKSAILGFKDYEKTVETLKATEFNGYNRAISEAFVAELLAPQILERAVVATGNYINIPVERKSFIDEVIMQDESRKLFVENLEENINRPLKLALHDTAEEQKGIAGKTAWGLVNGITRYVDHTYGRNADNRLSNAWFGQGDNLKTKALDLAVEYTQALAR